MEFKKLAQEVMVHLGTLSNDEMFRLDLDMDVVWNAYLDAFPAGTNEIYKTRRVHDGSYDRAFIRAMGNVATLDNNGNLLTMWDAPLLYYPYTEVFAKMARLVKSAPIKGVFRTAERKFGHVSNVQELPDGGAKRWYHFNHTIAPRHWSATPDKVIGEINSAVHVFQRGLETITLDAIETVLALIQQGALYRGAESQAALEEFKTFKTLWSQATAERVLDVIKWKQYGSRSAKLRNTAMGTLLVNLSEGMDLESAVRKFESIMAPANYKRPTALVTPKMVDQAVDTLRAMGLESALARRHASIDDMSVNDVLWVGAAQAEMKDGLKDFLKEGLSSATSVPVGAGSITEMSVEQFMGSVVSDAIHIEALLTGDLERHLVSVTAPVDPNAGSLFQWGNGFGWSYKGDITDTVKERVKAAGGNVNAKLRVSLSWFNTDDLDLHAQCPDGWIYFGQPYGGGRGGNYGRILDVDMNITQPIRNAVENLSWTHPQDGKYEIKVNNYRRRETADPGFSIEMEFEGQITVASYGKGVAPSETISVMQFTLKDGKVHGLVVNPALDRKAKTKQVWGLTTEQFVPVTMVMNSPNHWGGKAIGNKHWIFILKGCKNDEPTRGIYNEFLRSDLIDHRKVFEMVGNRTKVEPSDRQLSGLGFGLAKDDSVVLKVTKVSGNNTSTRLYRVSF